MKSSLYHALVQHERLSPAYHKFQYQVPVFVFDLTELESDTLDGPLFGRRLLPGSPAKSGPILPRLISFRERDYLYSGPGGLRDKLGRALSAGGLDPELALGSVRLVTSARFLGSVFNPVSFWLIFGHDQAKGMTAAVAEVNNTFGEKHIYVLGNGQPVPFPVKFSAHKEFHVSPFNDMQGDYNFLLADPRTGLDLSVNLVKDGQDLLKARLWSEQPGRPVKSDSLFSFLLHPQRVLTYPRILKQATTLYYRRRLHIYSKPEPSSPLTIRQAKPPSLGHLSKLVRKILPKLLGQTKTGQLKLVQPDGQSEQFQGQEPGPIVELSILDPRFYKSLALSGDIGFGQAYTAGWWTTPDLPELLRFFLLNREQMRLSKVLNLPKPVVFFYNRLRRLGGLGNTRPGARQNIHAHYDLGDQLFEIFLDPSMTYSCAYFEHKDMSLTQAQQAKFDLVAKKLNLGPQDHLLEIGFGWGGFALYAAENFGCRVDGVTISENQLAFAQQQARQRGLDNLISFKLMDYRDIENSYNKIVSIEMLEAVGHQHHQKFFAALEQLLAPGGKVFLQFIAIHDQRYHAYRFEGDWIRKHIFPGGLLPSLTRVMEVVRDKTGFTLRSLQSLAPDYVLTLAAWRHNLLNNQSKLERLGYNQNFLRKWDYYFAYCQAGFSCRVIDDYQIVLARPEGIQPRESTLDLKLRSKN